MRHDVWNTSTRETTLTRHQKRAKTRFCQGRVHLGYFTLGMRQSKRGRGPRGAQSETAKVLRTLARLGVSLSLAAEAASPESRDQCQEEPCQTPYHTLLDPVQYLSYAPNPNYPTYLKCIH